MEMRRLLNLMEEVSSRSNRLEISIPANETGQFTDQLKKYGNRFKVKEVPGGELELYDTHDGYHLDTFTSEEANRLNTSYAEYPLNQIAMYVSQKGWAVFQEDMVTEGNSSPCEIEHIFMQRDGMTRKEAAEELQDMKSRVNDGENPEEVLYDYGLEPDYIFDLI